MYLKTRKLLQLILVFCIKSSLSQTNEPGDICDCNCDVQIGVIEHHTHKLESLEQLVRQNAGNLSLQSELLRKIHKRLPANCMEAAVGSFKSGIYKIQYDRLGEAPFTVWCEEETEFGGWIVIQRRVSADVDFYRNWNQYKDGFGDLSGNYWIGLEKLYALTASCEQQLYIKLETFGGEKYFAKYDLFVIGSEEEDYVLKKVGHYKGNAKDYFVPHEGSKFTTHDRDNDEKIDENCARKFRGAWWYNNCYWSNLNGDYSQKHNSQGVTWNGIRRSESLKFVQMMIRPTEKCMQRLSMKNSSL